MVIPAMAAIGLCLQKNSKFSLGIIYNILHFIFVVVMLYHDFVDRGF